MLGWDLWAWGGRGRGYQRIIRIVAGLRDKQNRARLVVLEILIPDRAAFYLPPLLAFQHLRGAGDMVERVVVEDAEAHCRDSFQRRLSTADSL